MEKITIKIKANSIERNEMHFEVQLRTRSHTFRDRKRLSKQGYRKHKGDYY